MDKFVKPWKNRSKIVSNTGTALWTPKGDFRWCSAAGQSVVLAETNLSALCNAERRALQRLALLKLQTLSIQCTIPAYKDEGKNFGKRLRRSLKGRKRTNAESGSASLSRFSGGKGRTAVFATPLNMVIKNDRLASAGVTSIPRRARRKSEPTALSPEQKEKLPRRRRASSNTPPATSALKRQQMKQSKSYGALQKNSISTASLKSAGSSGDFSKPKRHSDSDSILISDLCPEQKPIGWKSQLLDALTLSSTSASASCLVEKPELPIPSAPKVPSIVLQSIKYLEKHGLHALGIFRVAGSKKRLKQLRDEFDSGLRETFSEDDNAHDVAALFKEFLRCLPEPLMTRELYNAFLSTQRFKDGEMQLNALKYLWYLLPDSNRDTLQCLLCFLSKVAKFAEDTTDENDQIVPGNKMNCRNLATLMGPNILHKVKSPNLQNFVVENMQRAEEHDEVIDVTEDLINNHDKLSAVSPEMHDQVMRFLLQTEPETVDFILRRKVKSHLGEDMENIIKGSSDIISEIDDQETNARLQQRLKNTYDSKKGSPRTNSVPPSKKQFNSTGNVQTDVRTHARCASVDAEFVKTFGLSPCNCSVANKDRNMRKQRSYATSEPATPKMNSSMSFSYFPASSNSSARTTSTGNSLNSSPSYSPTEVTYHDCRLHSYPVTQNGSSVSTDDASSIAESRDESDITSEDFDDIDMRRQWLEWEALSRNFNYDDDDFLDQETLV